MKGQNIIRYQQKEVELNLIRKQLIRKQAILFFAERQN